MFNLNQCTNYLRIGRSYGRLYRRSAPKSPSGYGPLPGPLQHVCKSLGRAQNSLSVDTTLSQRVTKPLLVDQLHSCDLCSGFTRD